MAMVAVLGALEYRDRTGSGQYIDLSMQDIAAWLSMPAWNGAGARSGTPAVLACADGYVVVAEPKALDMSGAPQPTSEELTKLVAGLSRQDAVARLASYGLPATPVLSVREASLLPQTAERRLWFTATEDGFDWPMLSSPIRLTATPPMISRQAPAVNQDGEAILRELGITPPAGARPASRGSVPA
jgi:crotonobetainyl-CoA:carnitine CoA-transferase CaiB-like acyl-CoA transferase